MLTIETKEQAALVCKLCILFVEDDDEVRESMARYLARRVGNVYVAQNGLEGLSLFREIHPDVVISDIRMGGMDGIGMCREIRKTDPDLPVIFISAHNESEILLTSIDLGVAKFIVKPVDTDVLMETIISLAESLERQHSQERRMQQMSLMLNETDYESESVKSYVSRYLDGNRHEELPNIRHVNIPKLGVSGDFYSVEKHRDDLYVMLADGAGHGLSAVIPALQMPRIFQQQAARGFSLRAIAAELNRALNEQRISEHFVATTLLRASPEERCIEVLNCGNPPVLVFDDEGVLLHTGHSNSTALGMLGDAEFSAEVQRFNMMSDARIYLFTDGMTDTLQASNPAFDDNALEGLFCSAPPPAVFDAVSEKIREAAERYKVDDVTLLEIRCDCEAPQEIQIEIPLPPRPQNESDVTVALDQMTLLYVEDDEITRDYLALYLNRRFGKLYIAKDGREGLGLFIKHRPDIVLTDIRMPLMNGLEMAEEIRKVDRDVPIIVTTGSDNAEDAERMFEMGISRFHLKPLDPDKLSKTLQACIRHANTLNRLRLSASALQASSLAVITADRDKRIVDVNPAFCRITGYALAEVLGHNPALLSSGKDDAGYYKTMWDALDESGSWSGELRCLHKNGETVSEWLTVNAVKDDDGALSGYHFIFSDISERKLNDEKVRQLTLHDSLTQLPNRAMFESRVSERLTQSEQTNGNLILLCLNLDRFAEINNVLGVRAGDEALLTVAQRLLDSVGSSDVLCRMGGNEFAILMQMDGGREAIERKVAELSRVIKQPIAMEGQAIQLRVSIGIGLYPSDGESYEALVKSASSAMNHAQQTGGDTYRFFDRSISQRDERQVILQQGIKSGLQNNEFHMLYQPKFSLSQQRVVGAEALVRWTHPTQGLISPAEFIPLAENSGAVIEISEWIIDTVCAQLADWRGKGFPQVPVSINISPVHFWRGNLVESLQSGMQKWGIAPDMLPIEVTEGVVMDTSERTLQVLGQLKALGFHLSIDDFGTGYSSLKYLKDMPISELKIDRSFIIEIPEEGQPDDLSRTAIPRAIIQLASEFNLSVVAEGVETESQRKFLLENGCDVIQGYLFSRPVPADEFAKLLA